jgi:hypothetical protein
MTTRESTLKKLEATLAEWETAHTWGSIEIEIQDGAVVLLRKETKEKFRGPGGHYNVPRSETR